MESHIDNLPIEALHDILQLVRNSSTKSELSQITSLSSCCHLWHNVAKPILWRDVVLNNDSLPLFLATANQANLALVRSLTINASTSPDHWVEGNPAPMYYGGEKDHLEKLAEILPSMVTMTSFSFRAQPTNSRGGVCLVDHMRPWTKFALKALLKGLPEDCTSIELDTTDQHNFHPETHLCDTIRQVLSRMKHVRLSLTSMCQSAFESPKGIAEPMASLETLIINLNCGYDHSGLSSARRTTHCKPVLTDSGLFKLPLDQQTFVAMVESAINAKAYPRATRISIFDGIEGPYLRKDFDNRLSHTSLEEHNLLTDTVTKMPYIVSQLWPDSDFIRYVNSKGQSEGALGHWIDLSTLAESHAWGTTILGSRLPDAFTKSEAARDKGYVFERMPEIDLKKHHESKMNVGSDILWGEYIFSDILAGVGKNGTASKHAKIMDKRTGHVTLI